ncbi:MAG: hypothetical protein H0V18_07560 [Pyrinomonadaceae bacterium]|nr:hypothetical protein [Pyrinomonadaceae bacterium]
MCVEDDSKRTRTDISFNPQTKCCNYIPDLPNYLVGRILAGQDPNSASGRATVEARLRAGIAVTPLGLGQPPSFQVLYGHSRDSLFGRSRTLRCPHYLEDEGGRCGVWNHRAALCATWYCKYVRGQVGLNFWTAMHQLLSVVEKSLTRWCVLELDVGAEALKHLFPASASPSNGRIDARSLDGIADPAEARELWGHWAGRETEFYMECDRLVEVLDWRAVTAIGGPEIGIFSSLVCEGYRKIMSDEIPTRLKVGSFNTIRTGQDFYRISSYNGYDPIDLPKSLMTMLPYFDGRPTVEALQMVAAKEDTILSQDLIRRLVDFGVLISPGDS